MTNERCEDCISREEVLKHKFYIADDDGICYSVVRTEDIEKLPSVNLEEEKEFIPMTDLRKINTVISNHIITVRNLKIDKHEKELRLNIYYDIQNEIKDHLDSRYYNVSTLLIWLISYRNLMLNKYKEEGDKDYFIKAEMLCDSLQEIMKLQSIYIYNGIRP